MLGLLAHCALVVGGGCTLAWLAGPCPRHPLRILCGFLMAPCLLPHAYLSTAGSSLPASPTWRSWATSRSSASSSEQPAGQLLEGTWPRSGRHDAPCSRTARSGAASAAGAAAGLRIAALAHLLPILCHISTDCRTQSLQCWFLLFVVFVPLCPQGPALLLGLYCAHICVPGLPMRGGCWSLCTLILAYPLRP